MKSWEKRIIERGRLITWEHDEIVDYLVSIFKRDQGHLLLDAAADTSKRWKLRFILDYEGMCSGVGDTNFGGTVNYNKKQRRFDFIEYSDKRNWSVRISVKNPMIYCPANPQFPY